MRTWVYALLGLLGAVIMYAGDMLFYYTPTPVTSLEEDIFRIMSGVSDWRLHLGALCGPLATVFYIAGFYHIKRALAKTAPLSGTVIFVMLAVAIVFGAVFHAMFAPFGFVSRTDDHAVLLEQLMVTAFSMFYFYAFFMAAGLLYLMVLVLRGRTPFPKWILFFHPLVVWLWTSFFVYLPSPLLILLEGGRFNIMFALFFAASAVVLYRNRLSS